MAIIGVESITFGVSDPGTLVRFFDDFGLPRATGTDFVLPEGSKILVRHKDDESLPPPFLSGEGPREVIWGVDDDQALAAIELELRKDREVVPDDAGTLHCTDPNGIRIGFRVFHRAKLDGETPQENTLAHPRRWNTHRKWYDRARPKAIQHVVFLVSKMDEAIDFYVNRLNFRISDIARQRGVFLRADGRNEHHNLFFAFREIGFHHIAFSVDSVDELMAGANYMQRKKWKAGTGLGRHRISSVLYYYFSAPTGGEIEYAADTDFLDDNWQPRIWGPRYGNQHWLGEVNEANLEPPDVDVQLLPKPIPPFSQLR